MERTLTIWSIVKVNEKINVRILEMQVVQLIQIHNDLHKFDFLTKIWYNIVHS